MFYIQRLKPVKNLQNLKINWIELTNDKTHELRLNAKTDAGKRY